MNNEDMPQIDFNVYEQPDGSVLFVEKGDVGDFVARVGRNSEAYCAGC